MKNPFNELTLISETDIGRTVLCDICSKDWTDLPDCGGMVVQSKAVCPDCKHAYLRDLQKYNETHLIRAHCSVTKSFADFVREHRDGDNKIRLYSGRAPAT